MVIYDMRFWGVKIYVGMQIPQILMWQTFFSQSVSLTQYVVLSVRLSACLPAWPSVPVRLLRGFIVNTNV